jgi:TonB-linked SusC/RagA family outer membrane protein
MRALGMFFSMAVLLATVAYVSPALAAVAPSEGAVLSPATPPRLQSVGTILGSLVDARTGAPIGSAQVSILALNTGVLANAAGRYTFVNVPEGTHEVSVILIGYETAVATVTVTSGATVVQDFRMTQQAVALDQIVVTGVAGGTRRRAVGNAVASLDGAAVTRTAPVGTVQQVLRGRTPGVNMMGSGMVGAAPRIRIRGASTLSLGNNPLVYIDGVRSNNAETTGFTFGNNAGVRSALSSLDPEQIESIEVLKGPAAATLYGTEASRGVINVITKRGVVGRPQLDIMVRQGANFVANPSSRVGRENYWTSPTGEVSSLNMIDHMASRGSDVFTNGPVQTYNATLSGGSGETRYFFSGSYSDETGALDWNYAKRLNARTNLDSQLSESLSASVSLGYTTSDDRLPTDGFRSTVEGVQFGSPRWLAENRCSPTPTPGCDVYDGWLPGNVPPREQSLFNEQALDRFAGSLSLTHEAFGWLTSRITTGLDYSGEVNVAFREFQTNDTSIVSLGSIGSRGFRNEGRTTRFLSTTDVSSTAELNVTPSLSSSTSMGVQYYTRSTSFLSTGGQEFAGPGLSTITATARQNVPANNFITDKTLGLYVQETLAWRNRLFVTGAVRVDNNSAFGSDIDLVTYPKASVSWVLTEEPWFESMAPSWLNTLRIRGAWGQSGEQPVAFSALRTWSPVTGPLSTAGVTPLTVGNPDLSPEVGEELEIGFDSDLFSNRLSLQATYYHKLTKDAILSRDLPPSGGFAGNQFVNAGRIKNQGVEIQLDARLVETAGFSWDVSAGFAYNSAEILQLSGLPGDTTIVFNSWSSMEHRVGYAPNSWFGPRVLSGDIDPTTGRALNAMCDDGIGGATACFDAGGTTIAPRVNLGRAIAPTELSLSNDFTIGGRLRVHTLFTSELGHKRFDNSLRQRCRLYRVCRVNHFPEEADDIRLMATIQSSDQIIDAWVNDVGFVRLKEISLSYDIPENLIQGFGMSRASAQIAATNMLTFTDWTGSDPEVLFSSGGRAFMEQNNLPQPQQIVTTIRFSF